VESKRLKFRKFTDGDFSLYFQLVSNEQVMKYTTGFATPEAKARKDFVKVLAFNKVDTDFGVYAIWDKAQTLFVGLGKLTITEAAAKEAELGYLLLPEYWGKGLGSEIATFLVAHGCSQKRLQWLTAIIDPENIASQRILEKNKFYLDRIGEWRSLPAAYYKRDL